MVSLFVIGLVILCFIWLIFVVITSTIRNDRLCVEFTTTTSESVGCQEGHLACNSTAPAVSKGILTNSGTPGNWLLKWLSVSVQIMLKK